MTVKSNMTKQDKKKRVRINRDVKPVVLEVLEQIAESVVEEVVDELKEAVIEVVEEVEQAVEQLIENIVLSHPETLEEIRSLPPPPTEDEYDDKNCPVSPCASPKKRCKKVVEKPLINEKGEYLNPRTNRYVKPGTSAFKQLVKDGVIFVDLCV
jgi:hypothetical protein